MNDYQVIYQRLKHNFRYYKGDRQIRIKAIILKRILAAIIAGRTVTQAAAKEGYDRKYFYFWLNRLKAHNFDIACLAGYSKRPKRSANATPQNIIELAQKIRGKYNIGGHCVAIILRRDYQTRIAGSTLGKIFKQRGISNVYRYKRINQHTMRYAAENPLESVQTDSAWTGFSDDHDNRIYFFPVIDDCSRVATVHVCDSKSGEEAVTAMQKFIDNFAIPEQVQTDNGVEFTNRYTSRRNVLREKPGTYALFEQFLFQEKIKHRLIRVRTPEHNGKVERFNQTLKIYLQNNAHNGLPLKEFQYIVDDFVNWYNRVRPHSSLKGLTPYERFYGVRLAKIA